MKTRIFLFVLCYSALTFIGKAGNLYTSLLEVNDRWAYETHLPSDIFSCPEAKDPVQDHLLAVHAILKSRSVEYLTPEERTSRSKSLDILKDYALSGAFPNNLLHKGRRPVFIGPNGNYCAVGYLIKRSGRDDLARKISHNMNYEYLLNMKDDELRAWVDKSGFIAEELAWIQPAYNASAPFVRMNGGVDGPVNTIFPGTLLGEIIAAGSFRNADGISTPGIAQWKLGFAGYGWITFGSEGIDYTVYDMESYDNGIAVAGNIFEADTTHVASGVVYWDGTGWTALGEFYIGAMDNVVWDVEVYNGELYAGGLFKSHSSSSTVFTNLAKWNGSAWESVGGVVNNRVTSLQVHDGKLIIAGDFTSIDSVSFDHIAAYDGNNFSALGEGIPLPVYALESMGDTIFAGGEFTGTASTDTFGLNYFYNNQWQRVGGFEYINLENQRVECLENTPYGLFIGGDLYYPTWGTIGKNLLRYDNGHLMPYGVLDSTVHSLNYDPELQYLYIGGDFTARYTGDTLDEANRLNHITYVNLGQQFSITENQSYPSRLYPNPAKNQFSVEFEQVIPDVKSVHFYDISGKEYPLQAERQSPTLFHFYVRGETPEGVYHINFQTSEGEILKKVMLR